MSATDDSTTELVKLGEAKPLCSFDDYDSGIWYVYSYFDYRSSAEYVYLALREIIHDLLFLVFTHFAVEYPYLIFFKDFFF